MRIDLFKNTALRTTMVAAGALALTALVYSCSDQPTEGSTKAYNPLALITGGSPEVSFNNLDGSDVEGVAKVYRGKLNDDGTTFQDQTLTSLWGAFGTLAGGPASMTYCRAGGIDVPQDAGSTTRSNMAQQPRILEGTDVRWETKWPDGVTFDANVQLPFVPEITNILPYANVSASQNLTISTGTTVAGGEVMVTISYDPQRTSDKGLTNPPVSITDVPQPVLTYFDTQEDDGTLTVPTAELVRLVKNKVYILSVQRFRYVARSSSLATRKVGLSAISEYTTPFILVP